MKTDNFLGESAESLRLAVIANWSRLRSLDETERATCVLEISCRDSRYFFLHLVSTISTFIISA